MLFVVHVTPGLLPENAPIEEGDVESNDCIIIMFQGSDDPFARVASGSVGTDVVVAFSDAFSKAAAYGFANGYI